MGLTIMKAEYNEISLFQHWRKMATCFSIKKFFQQGGATHVSKYPFSQLGLLHEVSYFKCWGTQEYCPLFCMGVKLGR